MKQMFFVFAFIIFQNAAFAEVYGLFDSSQFNSSRFEIIKKATVSIVENEKLFSPEIPSLSETYNFCMAEKFEQEKLWSNCSGVLISKNTVLTAGHCVHSIACPAKSFVFDYSTNEDIPRIQNDKNNIYACKKVLYWSKPVSQKQLKDFAIIQLDRDVVGREPIVLTKSKLTQPENILAVGHPLGMPLKFSSGYIAEKNSAKNSLAKLPYYAAQLLTHPGLSGGAVYNSRSELVGLLVRGASNIEKDGQCQRVATCDKDSCPWAEIQKLDLKTIEKYIR